MIDSYVKNSTFIGHAEHVHTNAVAPDRVPSVDELAELNLQRAVQRLRECLDRPGQVRTVIDHLALVPAERVVALLRQLKLPDHRLWGAVLLYMGKRRCRSFLEAMATEEQTRTVRSAVEHLCRRCDGGRAADAAATLLDTDRQVQPRW